MITTLDVRPISRQFKRFLILLTVVISVNIQAVTINKKIDAWYVNIMPCSHIYGTSAQGSLGAACSYCADLRGQTVSAVNQTDYNSGSCEFESQSGGTYGPYAAYGNGSCRVGYLSGSGGTCYTSGHSSTKESVSGLDAGLPASVGSDHQG